MIFWPVLPRVAAVLLHFGVFCSMFAAVCCFLSQFATVLLQKHNESQVPPSSRGRERQQRGQQGRVGGCDDDPRSAGVGTTRGGRRRCGGGCEGIAAKERQAEEGEEDKDGDEDEGEIRKRGKAAQDGGRHVVAVQGEEGQQQWSEDAGDAEGVG